MDLSLETPGQCPGFIMEPRQGSTPNPFHSGASGRYPSKSHQPIHKLPGSTAGLPPSRPGPLVKKRLFTLLETSC